MPERNDRLLDGARSLCPAILALLESRPRPGAVIIADGVELSMRRG